MATLTNLLNPSSFSCSNVTISNGVYTFATGVLGMITQSLPTPTIGHKYYGRVYQLAVSGYTNAGDGRFEYFGGDGEYSKNLIYAQAHDTTKNGQWHMFSAIKAFTSLTGSGWTLRSFTVNGTATFQRKEHLIIDLTDAYGSGNEPTKEWCDAHIPYFTGTYELNAWKNIIASFIKTSNATATLTNISPISSWTNSSTDTRSYFDWQAQSWIGTSTYIESYSLAATTRTGTYSAIFRTANSATAIRLKHNGAIKDLDYAWISSGVYGNHLYYTRIILNGANPTVVNGLSLSEIMLIDLTSSYGSGNEPTKAWCDANIPYFVDTHTPWHSCIAAYVKAPRLPNGLQEVTYLQSNGTQYIDTGIEVAGDLYVELDFQYASYDSNERYIFGSDPYVVFGMIQGRGRTYEYGSERYFYTLDTNRHTATVGNKIIFDGTTIASSISGGSTNTHGYLFAAYRNGSAQYYSYTKLYSCRMYKNNVLVRDFVPFYRPSDGYKGLYDLISGQMFSHSNYNAFSIGSVVSSWKQISLSKVRAF